MLEAGELFQNEQPSDMVNRWLLHSVRATPKDILHLGGAKKATDGSINTAAFLLVKRLLIYLTEILESLHRHLLS